MEAGFFQTIISSISRRIENRNERKAREAAQREYEKTCHFCDGISQEEFAKIVYSVTGRIKRIDKCVAVDSKVLCSVYSQSHISLWIFIIDFNDHGRLTGDWSECASENDQSEIPTAVARQIRDRIKARYRQINN